MKKGIVILAIVGIFFSVNYVAAEELQSFVATKDTTLLEITSEFSDTSTGFFLGYGYDSAGDFYGWNQKIETVNGRTVYGWKDGISNDPENGREVLIRKGTVVKVPKSWKRLDKI